MNPARLNAIGALLVLQASFLREEDAYVGFCRIRSVECLRALQAEGESGPWLHVGLADIGDLRGTPASEIEGVVADCICAIEDLLVAEAKAEFFATRASRPASPPPPSERGDEETEEYAAARDARDTDPPLAEAFATGGSDTERTVS